MLELAGFTTIHAEGDADATIADAAIESAKSISTVLVGDDTEILVLLCYHADINSSDIFFRPELKADSTKHRVWDIMKTKATLDENVCSHILFIQTILGCDSTSRVQRLRKAGALNMIMKNAKYHQLAQIQ